MTNTQGVTPQSPGLITQAYHGIGALANGLLGLPQAAKNVAATAAGAIGGVANGVVNGGVHIGGKVFTYPYNPDLEGKAKEIEQLLGHELVEMADWVAEAAVGKVKLKSRNNVVGWIKNRFNDFVSNNKPLVKTIAQAIIYQGLIKLAKDVDAESLKPLDINARRQAVLEKFLSFVIVDEKGAKSLRQIESMTEGPEKNLEKVEFFRRISNRLMTYLFPKQISDLPLPAVAIPLVQALGWEEIKGSLKDLGDGNYKTGGVAGALYNLFQNFGVDVMALDRKAREAKKELPNTYSEEWAEINSENATVPVPSTTIEPAVKEFAKGVVGFITENFPGVRKILTDSLIKKVLSQVFKASDESKKAEWKEKTDQFVKMVGNGMQAFVKNNPEHGIIDFANEEAEDLVAYAADLLAVNVPQLKNDKEFFKKAATTGINLVASHFKNLKQLISSRNVSFFGDPIVIDPEIFKPMDDKEFAKQTAKRLLGVFFPNGKDSLPVAAKNQEKRWEKIEKGVEAGIATIFETLNDESKRNELLIKLIRARRTAVLKQMGKPVPKEFPEIPKDPLASRKLLVSETLEWRDAEINPSTIWRGFQKQFDKFVEKNLGPLLPVKKVLDPICRFIFITVLKNLVCFALYPVLYGMHQLWRYRNKSWISGVIDMIAMPENKRFFQDMTSMAIGLLEKDYPLKNVPQEILDKEFKTACKLIVNNTLGLHPHKSLRPLLKAFVRPGASITHKMLRNMVDTKGSTPIEHIFKTAAGFLAPKKKPAEVLAQIPIADIAVAAGVVA